VVASVDFGGVLVVRAVRALPKVKVSPTLVDMLQLAIEKKNESQHYEIEEESQIYLAVPNILQNLGYYLEMNQYQWNPKTYQEDLQPMLELATVTEILQMNYSMETVIPLHIFRQ
jgi:hypothetical protein